MLLPAVIGIVVLCLPTTRSAGAGLVPGIALGSIIMARVCSVRWLPLGTELYW